MIYKLILEELSEINFLADSFETYLKRATYIGLLNDEIGLGTGETVAILLGFCYVYWYIAHG